MDHAPPALCGFAFASVLPPFQSPMSHCRQTSPDDIHQHVQRSRRHVQRAVTNAHLHDHPRRALRGLRGDAVPPALPNALRHEVPELQQNAYYPARDAAQHAAPLPTDLHPQERASHRPGDVPHSTDDARVETMIRADLNELKLRRPDEPAFDSFAPQVFGCDLQPRSGSCDLAFTRRFAWPSPSPAVWLDRRRRHPRG